jgi:hypothetical protein
MLLARDLLDTIRAAGRPKLCVARRRFRRAIACEFIQSTAVFNSACASPEKGLALLPLAHERLAKLVRRLSSPIAKRYLPAMYRYEVQPSRPQVSGL